MSFDAIHPEAYEILQCATQPEPQPNGKVPAPGRMDMARLVGTALGRADSGDHKRAGSRLAQELRDNGYSLAEAATAFERFRRDFPEYTDKEMQSALNKAYPPGTPANEGQTKKTTKAKPRVDIAEEAGAAGEPRQAHAERASAEGSDRKVGPEPSMFQMTDTGVYYAEPVDEDSGEEPPKPLLLCGPLQITGRTCDNHGDSWGRLLEWDDKNGQHHIWAMPMSLLAGDANELRARLLDGGLYLSLGRKAREMLLVYLQAYPSEEQILCTSRVGWHGESFVLPGITIGPPGGGKVPYQTPHETEHYLDLSGSVEDSRNNVGRFCSGNSRLILAVSCAFAGPTLSLVGGESGGLHFFGTTSTGKTTTLVVGGSVLGGGSQNGFVRTWRATTNGLESVAELHNGLCLFLDELAQVDARDAAETAYLLGNGTGKTRMTRATSTRKNLQWNLLFVSAGEITLADHAQTAGKRVKGGAEVRLLNIEADAGAGLGLFESLHGAESADSFSRQLKDAARRYYGAPIRTFLEYLVRNRGAAEAAVRNFQKGFMDGNVPTGASGEVFRAAQRFALIAAAGELATDAGITGWKSGEAIAAAARCLKSWIAGRGTAGSLDAEAAIRQVRRFIEANCASRFQVVRPGAADSSIENQIVVNRAGYRQQTPDGETEYLVLRETFKAEVCAGFDYRMVAGALAEQGFLDRRKPALTKNARLPGLGQVEVFCIKSSILE